MIAIRRAVCVAAVILSGMTYNAALAAPIQRVTPPKAPAVVKPPKTILALQRPDFAVESIIPVTDFQNNITAVTVTIVNLCAAVKSGSPYVTVDITDPANGAAGAIVGYNALAFSNGEKLDTKLVNLGKTLKPGLTIRVTVNEDKALPEAWGGNNFRQINPNIAPFPPGKDYCNPANYE